MLRTAVIVVAAAGVFVQGQPSVCVSYSPASLNTVQVGQRDWELRADATLLERFRTNGDAQHGLEIARQFKQQCSIGKRGSAGWTEMWLPAAPSLTVSFAEDCAVYHPAKLAIYHDSAQWTLGEPADGNWHGAMLVLDDEASARVALDWLRPYSNQCFIGRKDMTGPKPAPLSPADRAGHVMRYWKQ